MFHLPAFLAPSLLALALTVQLAGCGGGQADDATQRAVVADDTRRHALAAGDLSASALFAYAERAYADLFPSGSATQTLPPYTYRYYPATGNYLGLADGSVYVLGPVSGGSILRVGAVADFACVAQGTDCTAAPQASRIASSYAYSSAVLGDGRVLVWGRERFVLPGVPAAKAVYDNGYAWHFHLVLTRGGEVWAWGYEPDHAFGVPLREAVDFVAQPVRVPGLTEIVDLTSCSADDGGPAIFALRADGTVWIMPGEQRDGRMVPRQLSGIGGVRAFAAFDDNEGTSLSDCRVHAIKDDGSLWLMRGSRTRLADRSYRYDATPQQVTGLPPVSQASCTIWHCLAVATDGRVWSWGANWSMELGVATPGPRQTPGLVPAVTGVRRVVAVENASYAITAGGSVIHWGGWQLEQPSPSQGTPLRLLHDGFDVVDAYGVRNGGLFAVRRNGEVLAWGDNVSGKLTDGAPNLLRITRIPGLEIR